MQDIAFITGEPAESYVVLKGPRNGRPSDKGRLETVLRSGPKKAQHAGEYSASFSCCTRKTS